MNKHTPPFSTNIGFDLRAGVEVGARNDAIHHGGVAEADQNNKIWSPVRFPVEVRSTFFPRGEELAAS